MLNKLTLAAGFGAGYVLGAKAGKERYRQIEARFREFAGMPAVQNATTQVKATAADLADTAKAKAADTVDAVSEKVSAATTQPAEPTIDLSTPVGARTGAAPRTGATPVVGAAPVVSAVPVAGAAPSGSAPDVPRP